MRLRAVKPSTLTRTRTSTPCLARLRQGIGRCTCPALICLPPSCATRSTAPPAWTLVYRQLAPLGRIRRAPRSTLVALTHERGHDDGSHLLDSPDHTDTHGSPHLERVVWRARRDPDA